MKKEGTLSGTLVLLITFVAIKKGGGLRGNLGSPNKNNFSLIILFQTNVSGL
jgi:hypothetical protein